MWLPDIIPVIGNPPTRIASRCHNGHVVTVSIPENIKSLTKGRSIAFPCFSTPLHEEEEEQDLQQGMKERCCCRDRQQLSSCRVFKSEVTLTKCPRVQMIMDNHAVA